MSDGQTKRTLSFWFSGGVKEIEKKIGAVKGLVVEKRPRFTSVRGVTAVHWPVEFIVLCNVFSEGLITIIILIY